MNVCQIRAMIIVALVTVVVACSFKTVYNRLDVLIPEYVEGMVTLDDVLEEQVEQRTQVLLHWHRNTQLKQYADWLRAVQQDAGARLTEETLQQRISEMEGFWQSLLVKVNDEMAYLLPLLDKEQQEELFIKLEDSNEEFREEFVDLNDEERIENYAERISGTYENWMGELTDAQQLAVERAAVELISTAELRLQRRLKWQNGIRGILATHDTLQHRTARLREFLAVFEQYNDEAIEQTSAINRKIIIRLTVQISHSMTDEQKDFFISKTGDYIRMFTELAENR